jgi:glutamyl-tRNA synthetase
MPFVESAGWLGGRNDRDRVKAIVEAAGERIKFAGDILDFDFCFVADDELKYDEKAMQKRIAGAEGASDLLTGFAETIPNINPFDAATIESD